MLWEIRAFYSWESGRPRLSTFSEKILKIQVHTPLADHQALHKPEMKTNAELKILSIKTEDTKINTEPTCKDWEVFCYCCSKSLRQITS